MAWDLLTRVYGLPDDCLYVTCFEGDASLGLKRDLEAQSVGREQYEGYMTEYLRQMWRDIGLEEVDLTVLMAEEQGLKVDMLEEETARLESLALSKKGKFKAKAVPLLL
jgi:alanyl-tRNA synthetase